jgi:Polyketide cyclase / dehydrase and lipid transport
MPSVSASRLVPLEPAGAFRLWTDVRRWPTFIEGFAHVVEKDEGWPAEGSKLVWVSPAGGRGRVTEMVLAVEPGSALTTRVLEASLRGVQAVGFDPADAGTLAHLSLEYHLNPTGFWRQGPVGKVTDALFIRRALADSLARTLRRFATEAAEEQAL